MGLFDIFKKQSTISNREKLTLEILLERASSEPAFRAEFYARLLTDKLVVITDNRNQIPEGETTLKENTKVNLVSYEDGKIPVFTSTDRIFDKGIIKEQVNFLEMKGKDLFEMTKGATFILNPYSDYGKELLPNEIQSLLGGTILTDSAKTLTIEKESPIQIGQPAVYPTEIVSSLTKLFTERQTVKAAYLGWIYNPESGEPPHYIFGLDAEGDIQSLTQEAGFTAKQFLKSDEFVDFIRIDNKGGLSDYFTKSTTPFYKK